MSDKKVKFGEWLDGDRIESQEISERELKRAINKIFGDRDLVSDAANGEKNE